MQHFAHSMVPYHDVLMEVLCDPHFMDWKLSSRELSNLLKFPPLVSGGQDLDTEVLSPGTMLFINPLFSARWTVPIWRLSSLSDKPTHLFTALQL